LPSTAVTQTAGDNTTAVATDAFVTTAVANAAKLVTSVAYTSSWSVGTGDLGMEDDYTSSSAGVATIPLSLTPTVGSIVGFRQLGTGPLTITGAASVTVNGVSAGSFVLAGQYQTAFARQTATNVWVITGSSVGVTQATGDTSTAVATDLFVARNVPGIGMARVLAPTGAIAENFPRWLANSTDIPAMTSGTPYIWPGPLLPAGVAVNHLNLYQSGTAPSGQTHAWLALLSTTGVVLATTADAGSTAWNAGTFVTLSLALSATYTPSSDVQTLLCFLFAGTTAPTFRGAGGQSIQASWAPYLIGKSATSTGLTGAPTLASSIGLPSSGTATNAIAYCFAS
jgi:hypothetical protein